MRDRYSVASTISDPVDLRAKERDGTRRGLGVKALLEDTTRSKERIFMVFDNIQHLQLR
jgi:hypothetical protein